MRFFYLCYYSFSEFSLVSLIFFHHVFISGAKEGVIVVWQLENGIKNFKPRFGSPLLYFSESVDLSTCYVRNFFHHLLILLYYFMHPFHLHHHHFM